MSVLFYAHDVATGARKATVPFDVFEWHDTIRDLPNLRGEFPPFKGLVPLNDPTLIGDLEPLKTAIVVEEGGTPVYGGIVWDLDFHQANSGGIGVIGEGWWSYWRRKRWIRSIQGMTYATTGRVPGLVSFSAVEQLSIAEDLIAHAHSTGAGGDLAFARTRRMPLGLASGYTRSPKWTSSERKSIGAAIEMLARQDGGFDHQVSMEWNNTTSPPVPALSFDTWYPRIGNTVSKTLTHESNSEVVTIRKTARDVANPLVVVGAGIGDAALSVEVEDINVRAPLAPLGYPTAEDSYAAREVDNTAELTAVGSKRLLYSKAPTYSGTVSVYLTAYTPSDIGLGDAIRWAVTLGGLAVDANERVLNRHVSYVGNERVGFMLDLIDANAGVNT